MEDAFDSDDLDTVAERLTGMQNSLRLLSHVADYQVSLSTTEADKMSFFRRDVLILSSTETDWRPLFLLNW